MSPFAKLKKSLLATISSGKKPAADCSVSRLTGKSPRNMGAQFQIPVLFRRNRNVLLRRRVVPLVLASPARAAKAPAYKSLRRACLAMPLLMWLLIIAGADSTFAAGETASNTVPVTPAVATTNAVIVTNVASVTNESNTTNVVAVTNQLSAATNSTNAAVAPAKAEIAEKTAPASETVVEKTSNDDPSAAPELGQLPTPGVTAAATTSTNQTNNLQQYQLLLDFGRQQRREKDYNAAMQTLADLLKTNAPVEFQRPALFEMALVAQDDGKFVKAQQIFSQYLHVYPADPSVPEVLLRQGLVYRQMGVNTLAISKFYAVMSTALKLKLDNMDYYKKLVLQAQLEIADTYYLEGKFEEAADFFSRLLKNGSPQLNQIQLQYKLVRSLSFLTNHTETIAKAQVYLDLYTNSTEVPEVRFLLASSLKKLGRNHEAMKQVLLLLQSQQENVRKNPEVWIYWQQRAGNDIANQLYKEGDYLNALQIYLGLAELDHSPTWQFPVWYQSGLVYEQLQQIPKASEMYQRILDRQKELTDSNSTPTLQSLIEMAKWRKDNLDWMQKAKATNLSFQPVTNNNSVPSTVAAK